MEDSDKPQEPAVVKKTLKLKPGVTKTSASAAPIPAPAITMPPPAFSPKYAGAKSRDPASWADAHKNRMQAEMDALSAAIPDDVNRRNR